MRGAVDPCRQAGDHRQPGLAQMLGKGMGVDLALRRRVAAADDRNHRRLQEFDPALGVQQQRRIGGFEQRSGVGGVAERDDVARRGVAGLQPCDRQFQLGIEVVGRCCQRRCRAEPDDPAPRRHRSVDGSLRRAECGQQPTPRFAPGAGGFDQPQPGGELVALDHAGRHPVRAG